MRGEHPYRIIPIPEDMGSSPHARGTQHVSRRVIRSTGIIPACAGNTIRPVPDRRGTRDHPRMRGEHNHECSRGQDGEGSSPHARGTLPRHIAQLEAGGIIPACAGNTPNPNTTCRSSAGSSPHARGTPRVTLKSTMPSGIIPACAGNTPSHSSGGTSARDHPRMRGEHPNS